MEDQLMNAVGTMRTCSCQEMVINIVLVVVNRYPHKGLSCSQSFAQTIIFVSCECFLVSSNALVSYKYNF